MKILLLLLSMCFMFHQSSWALEQFPRERDTIDSLEEAVVKAMTHLTTPKLEERKRLLRSHQQRGYASTLAEVIRFDGFTSFLMYLRTRLQIEYSLSHELVIVDISARRGHKQEDSTSILPRSKPRILLPIVADQPVQVGLDIDWSFPADPWSHN